MKRFITALAVCALFVVPAAAYGVCTGNEYTWDGSSDSDWGTPDNWVPDTGFPGYRGSTDDCAIIPDVYSGSNTYPVLDQARTIESLTMRGGTSSTPPPVEIDTSSYVLTVTGSATFGYGSASDTESYVEKSGSGRIDVEGSIIIQGGSSSEQTVVEVTAGTIQTTEAP
jgi:hypothetical protein